MCGDCLPDCPLGSFVLPWPGQAVALYRDYDDPFDPPDDFIPTLVRASDVTSMILVARELPYDRPIVEGGHVPHSACLLVTFNDGTVWVRTADAAQLTRCTAKP